MLNDDIYDGFLLLSLFIGKLRQLMSCLMYPRPSRHMSISWSSLPMNSAEKMALASGSGMELRPHSATAPASTRSPATDSRSRCIACPSQEDSKTGRILVTCNFFVGVDNLNFKPARVADPHWFQCGSGSSIFC